MVDRADTMAATNADDNLKLRNTLASSSSPYLIAHAENPVHWQEWNPTTLALARRSNRLIFLSIGYHACHWCHVMEHESFLSPEVAAILNSSFIPIKVDRESRPDVDEIYMSYVTATTGSGGWPLNVFLTPDLQPVFGGTYWPAASSASMSSRRPSTPDDRPLTFLDILEKMENVWRNQRERCIESATDITQQLREFAAEGTHSYSQIAAKGGPGEAPEPLELDLLDDALDHFVSRYDAVHGGFSPATPNAPKFPTPPNLSFLLRIGASIASTATRFGFPSPVPPILGKKSCANAATMALHTLITVSRSGLRDHLSHGFHRYSVTNDWNLPHFEKMLYDNAQLLGRYCDAWALARDPEILGTIYSLVEYFTSADSPILSPHGAWFSSEDADSQSAHSKPEEPKKEGAFYVWTLKELTMLIPDSTHATILARHFGMCPDGNVAPEHDVADEFLTQNVLYIAATPSVLAKELGLPEEEIVRVIKDGRKKMAEYREKQRPKPAVDTKIITSWNALAIAALTRAAHTLADVDVERSQRCKIAAVQAAAFIRKEMYNETSGKLTRIYSPNADAKAERGIAFLDDYAYMTLAAHGLYDLTFENMYLSWAEKLQDYLNQHFWAETTGGYFQAEKISSSAAEPKERIINLKPGTDSALPSPNGVVAMNLLYLASYLEPKKDEYTRLARATIDAFAVEVVQHPFLFVSLLGAVVMNDEAVGVKTLLVGEGVSESKCRSLTGFSRTVRRTKDIKGDEIMICEKGGVCRSLRDGELDEVERMGEEEVASFAVVQEKGAAQ